MTVVVTVVVMVVLVVMVMVMGVAVTHQLPVEPRTDYQVEHWCLSAFTHPPLTLN